MIWQYGSNALAYLEGRKFYYISKKDNAIITIELKENKTIYFKNN